MKLTLPTNWDAELLDGVSQIPEVTSLYGKLAFDLVGGGRAGSALPAVQWDHAAAHIRAVRDRGLSFCYLLNAPCLGNLEQTRQGKLQLMGLVGQLVEMGVDAVSIGNLGLVSLVRRNFPQLRIRGSVLSWPTHLVRLKFQESLGVDPLVLPYSEFSRDFEMLRRIRSGLSCGLQLFANISCIYHCHYLAEHACSVGHASQANAATQNAYSMLDSYLWRCTQRRLLRPELFLMSRWIRPEDIGAYEALGYDEFKIIDRSRSTSWLLRAARAYAERRYNGNLLDIISLEMFGDADGFHERLEEQSLKRVRAAGAEERRVMLGMFRLRRRLFALGVTIDNDALGDFLEGFRTIRCAETFCEQCRYCHGYAERVVHFDRDEAARLAADIDGLLQGFLTAAW
ncbi:MAG: U32 family peptidase [Polyangiaceae bacterium]|nr:U32 family peptidase [Polyangiaceae bacterium]